jgi:hypothetical protein
VSEKLCYLETDIPVLFGFARSNEQDNWTLAIRAIHNLQTNLCLGDNA